MESWQNGYCTSLENWRPQGLGGSNPSPSVPREKKTPPGRKDRVALSLSVLSYWPCTLGAGPSWLSRDFIVVNPDSLT